LSPHVQWIATKAAEDKSFVFHTLAHRIDMSLLYEAYCLVRKDGAPGVDGATGRSYAKHLEENLTNLHLRLRTGKYRASDVRRVWIDKDDGRQRPLGIPTFEDKIVQRAVVILLEPIFETDFHDGSYGFRPGRGAHDALKTLREHCQYQNVQWILDVDIQGFFDNIDHKQLIELLHRRVKDGGIDRLIGKWLNAGILDGQDVTHPTKGTPQGGVISPLLANIYLHYVLDEWFAAEIQPRLSGRSFLVRYADDFVLGFENESDAKRVLAVLAKRLGKYGLSIHPEKTRLLPFKRPPSSEKKDRDNGTFDFLGFTHYWCRSRRGFWVIKRRTSRKRLKCALQRANQWCKEHRHLPVDVQHQTLCRKLKGYYQYYGLRGNYECLSRVFWEVQSKWQRWLSRCSQKSRISWEKFGEFLKRFPLPPPRIVHRNV